MAKEVQSHSTGGEAKLAEAQAAHAKEIAKLKAAHQARSTERAAVRKISADRGKRQHIKSGDLGGRFRGHSFSFS